jgi:hypothetical protein
MARRSDRRCAGFATRGSGRSSSPAREPVAASRQETPRVGNRSSEADDPSGARPQ